MYWLLAALLLAPPLSSRMEYQDLAATLAKGDLAKTRANLELMTRRQPGNARLWMLLAQTFAKEKKQDSARNAARQAAVLGKDDAEVQQGLTYLFVELQPDLPRAAGYAARFAALRPTDQTAWRRTASLYLETGQMDQAIAAGTHGLALAPSAELHSILGQAYSAKKDWRNAEQHLSQAVALGPYDEESHFRLAQMYMLRQEFPKAVEVLLNARRTFDKSAQIELALGVSYYGLRRFPEAVEQFLKTIRLAPAVPQPYAFLSRILEHAGGRMSEAAGAFAGYNASHPKDPLGYLWYAKALVAQPGSAEREAHVEQAQRLLAKSLELDAGVAETHYQLGCLLEQKHDYAGAALELEKSITLNPKQSAAHFHLSRVYDKLGRKQQAATERDLHEKLTEAENAVPTPSSPN